ncbi:MAG: alpha/beta hydrolase [Acidobacteriota bacterium]
MHPIAITAIRTYFSAMQRIAPRVAGRQAFRLFSTPRFRRPTPPAVVDVMERSERFSFEVEGEKVIGYRWDAADAGAPRVLLVHGWESRASRLAIWVDPLLHAGFSVVAFDAPGHGESSGRRSSPILFSRAARRAVDHVGAIDGVIGHSLGGLSSAIAITAAELIDERRLDPRRLLILAGAESGAEAMGFFCSALGLPDDFLPVLLDGAAELSGHRPATFDGHRILARRPVETLWLHDPEDGEASWVGAQRVAEAAPHVEVVAVEDVGHHRIARDPNVIRRGVEFLAA